MRLMELLKIFSKINTNNKKKYISTLLLTLIFLTINIYISCDEELPSSIEDNSYVKFDSTKVNAGSISWRHESPSDNGRDYILYIGEDQSVTAKALVQFDLSDSTFYNMEHDSILYINLVFNTYDQLWQGKDDSASINIKISQLTGNNIEWPADESIDIDVDQFSKAEIVNYTVPDTMTNSKTIEIDLEMETIAGALTRNQQLNLLFEAGDPNQSGAIQTLYSQNYSSGSISFDIGYMSNGDTLSKNENAVNDISLIEYKNSSDIENNQQVVSEGFESYLVLPVQIDTNFSQSSIVAKAELKLDYQKVIDYNSGIPLSIVNSEQLDEDFILSEIDSLQGNVKYAYSDTSSNQFVFDVKNLVQDVVANQTTEFYFVIWCEDTGPDIAQFILEEKEYDLEIFTANQELKK